MVHCCCVEKENTSKTMIFWFGISSSGIHLSSFFTFSICFYGQRRTEWSMRSSCTTSHVAVRGSASMMLSVGHCQLLTAGHWAPHPQGSCLLCKTSWTTTALCIHQQFLGQTCCWCWSCLRCFMTHSRAISLLYWQPVESGLSWGWHGKQLLPLPLHPSPESSSF